MHSFMNLGLFSSVVSLYVKTLSFFEFQRLPIDLPCENLEQFLKFDLSLPVKWEVLNLEEASEKILGVLDWISKKKAKVVYPGHMDYPAGFNLLEKPPLFLSYFGEASWKTHKCLSVIGSREANYLSLSWMDQHLSELLSLGNLALVSGGARGIDQRAHLLSIRHRKPTIAFLPSGLAQIYPNSFADWVDPIVQNGGAVMSELAPNAPMRTFYFHERNRLIVAMSDVLFVVEARRRSGSSMTARLASENSKTVAVLPGFPSEVNWSGSIDLLCQGAFPIRDALDLRTLLKI